MDMSSVKKGCICSICAALCYVLPPSFHAVGLGGVFCPMHLPVLLCGLLCGWPYGLVCGAIGPLLSSLLSGMPAPAMLVYMIPELCVYGLAAGLGMKWIHTGKLPADLYLSLVPAMVLGRVAGGLVRSLVYLSTAQSYSIALWASAYWVETLPGAVLQLILLPVMVVALVKAGLIPARYPERRAAA